MTQKEKEVLWLFSVILIGIPILILCVLPSHRYVQTQPAADQHRIESVSLYHEGFFLEQYVGGSVGVAIAAHEPDQYIKAFQCARKTVEKESHKKVVFVDIGGCPERVIFKLQK